MKYISITLILSLLFIVVISPSSVYCQYGSAKEASLKIPANNIQSPDKILDNLIKTVPAEKWREYQKSNTSIGITDRQDACINIGDKSANALLCVFLKDDTATWFRIRKFKNASKRLNIRSDEIETIAEGIEEDLDAGDTPTKAQKVKKRINLVRIKLEEALIDIGKEEDAFLIEVGSWIEALRQTSGIIIEHYSSNVSRLLSRQSETDYFMKNFKRLENKVSEKNYKNIMTALTEIRTLMGANENGVISKDSIGRMHQISTLFFKPEN